MVDGERVSGEQTPKFLELAENDQIDVSLEMVRDISLNAGSTTVSSNLILLMYTKFFVLFPSDRWPITLQHFEHSTMTGRTNNLDYLCLHFLRQNN